MTNQRLSLALILAVALASAAALWVPLSGGSTTQLFAAQAEGAEEEQAQEPIRTRAEVLGTLPCFNCHGLETFLATKVDAGEFSHPLHSAMQLHCNHCHSIGGHSAPKLNTDTCGQCHQLGTFRYTDGGYGTVVFDHAFHDSAFECGECHPDIFKMKRGLNKMPMGLINEGQLCGKCHDGNMAFDSRQCARCHKMG